MIVRGLREGRAGAGRREGFMNSSRRFRKAFVEVPGTESLTKVSRRMCKGFSRGSTRVPFKTVSQRAQGDLR